MTTTIKQHINSLPLDERADFIKDYNELQTELKQLNNMTKVSVFGQEATELKQLKPIKFIKALAYKGEIEPAECNPKDWRNVMLLEKKYTSQDFDLIMAWDSIDDKTIYLGHWNDGVI